MLEPLKTPARKIATLQSSLLKAALGLCAGAAMLLQTGDAKAAIQTFKGRAPINNTSSIPELYKHDVLYFTLSIDDSVKDIENYARPNDLGGITALGEFPNAIVDFHLDAYPGNGGSFDPSGVTFLPGDILSIDGTPSTAGGDYLEKLTLRLKVSPESLAAGATFRWVYLNLYNGTLYDNPSSRQLLLDTSSSPTGMTFAELFLHGPQTMDEFLSTRDPNLEAFVDGVFIEGLSGSGQLASGYGVTLEHVPGPLPILGAFSGWRASRQLRRRIRARR